MDVAAWSLILIRLLSDRWFGRCSRSMAIATEQHARQTMTNGGAYSDGARSYAVAW